MASEIQPHVARTGPTSFADGLRVSNSDYKQSTLTIRSDYLLLVRNEKDEQVLSITNGGDFIFRGVKVERGPDEAREVVEGMRRMLQEVFPNKPQPSGIEKGVCEDIARRQALGIAKYGQTVADNPLSLKQWLQHAYEETLDKAVYLKRAIAELDK
jgi:hypothetical protein